MNKFRNNLHSVLFSLDGGRPSQDFFDSGIDNRLDVELDFRNELDGLVTEVVEDPDFSNIITKVVDSKKNSEYFEENYQRFKQRIESQDSQGKKYIEVWNVRIEEGFKYLVSELEKTNFFAGCDDVASKAKRLAEVKVRYFNEVKNQYINNVWDATDEDFYQIKDKLFKAGSNNYPATIVLNALIQQTNDDVDNTKIDASIRESYVIDIDEETIQKNIDGVKNRRFGKKQNFLSEDLPNYFLRVKGKKWVGKTLESVGKFLGIAKIDRASEEDKDAIKDFLDVVKDIADEGKTTHEEALKALMNMLKNGGLTLNSKKTDYEKAIASNNISANINIKRVMKVGKMYLKTSKQGNFPENQHNIYYAVIQIMDKEGIDRTIAMFKDEVETYQKNKELDNEEAGEQLKQKDVVLFNISDKFNKNYNSALRLSERSEDSFKNKSVVDILADLNNDGYVRYSDNGVTKTGLQFKRIVSIYGEEKVLGDLLNQAKRLNNTMNLGLNELDFSTDKIQQGNKKLILLLQSIISHPGGDLSTLIGLDDNKRKEIEQLLAEAPTSPEDPRVQEAAKELTKNIKLGDVKIPGVKVATEEGLRQAVAGALYTDYMRGIGAGADVSFDQWVKGLSLNRGAQVTDKGVGVGLALEYSKKFDLGKGRSVTPGAAIGFIGIFSDEKTGLGFIAGASVDVAKEWINNNSVEHTVGLTISGNLNIMKGGQTPSFVAYAGVHWDRNKLAGIEKDRARVESEFHDKVVSPLVKGIAESLGDKRLNLDDSEIKEKVKKAIGEQIDAILNDEEKSRIDNMERERVVDNVTRFLSFYHDYDLSQEVFREEIARALSKQCSLARENDRLQSIDGDTYFSHVSAGVAAVFVLGAPVPVPVAHIGLGWTKHEKDGYVDKYFGKHEIEMPSQFKHRTKREQDMIADFNKYLPVEEGKKLILEKRGDTEFVVVPENLLRDVYVTPEMKGLMKKDERGNVLLDLQTYMDWPTLYIGSSTESVRINVGGYSDNMQNLATLTDDWFTTEEINAEALPGKDFMVTKELLDVALSDLKARAGDDIKDRLENFEFPQDFVEKNCTEKNKKYTIIINDNGTDIILDVEKTSGKGVAIEYRGRKSVDLISQEAKSIANHMYEQANMVVSNELRNISHEPSHKLHSEYKNFALAVKDQKYNEAKNVILRMLPEMDRCINRYQPRAKQVDFNRIALALQKLDGAELGKALMSINNIFARVAGVRGGANNEYSFVYGQRPAAMSTIIESRAKQIKNRIDGSNELPQDAKEAYGNLIDFTETYRINHSDKYQDNKKKTTTLSNAIGINLGNPISTENPLFNPEVYEDSIIQQSEINFTGKDILYNRVLNVVAGNKALISPILQALGFDENTNIGPSKITYKNGQIAIDINEKKVILKANMKIAYFAQCVNHMLILDNIHAEIEGEGKSVDFGARVSNNGQLYEGTGGTTYSTVNTDVHFAAALNGSQREDPSTHQEGGTSTGSGSGGTSQGGGTSTGTGTGGATDGGGGGGR